EHRPWIAYRQFCEHFAVPLALMHYLQEPLQPMMAAYPDGIPVTLAGKMLPWRSRFQVHVYLHILLHGKMAARAHMQPGRTQTFSRAKWENLLRSLDVMIRSFSFGRQTGVWSDYYHEAGTRDGYLERKKEIVAGWIGRHAFRTAIDAGANEGVFTMLLAEKNVSTISSDLDHYSVNRLYASLKEQHTQNVVPLVMDLSHPSPAIGVNNEERSSFLSRAHADVALSLALIHHLCIGRNIPFAGVAAMFRQMAPHLIIEFVPKQDEKVVQMLQQKPDVYEWYTDENFLAAFEQHFTVQEQQPVAGSGRTLYLMQAR
ncbi:MAG TPA: hypothetical protein VFZ78_07430, partial [Flavisolibacter sp.]